MQPNSTNVDSTQTHRTLIYVYAFFHPMSSQYVINKCKIERINQTINLLNCQTIKKNQIAKGRLSRLLREGIALRFEQDKPRPQARTACEIKII